jgi:hypothetical protein
MRKFVSLALVFVAAIAVSAVAQTNPATVACRPRLFPAGNGCPSQDGKLG